MLTGGIERKLFQAATFRAFDHTGTLLDCSAGDCRSSSLFDVASITKVFTALIFAKLRAEGRISEHTRLRELSFMDVPEEKGDITLFSLLCHTSGLPGYEPFFRRVLDDNGKIGSDGGSEAGELIIRAILSMPLVGTPGERILYSDPGYILLGHIIEQVSGSPLDRLLDEYVSVPIGLVDTCFRPLVSFPHCEAGRIVSTGIPAEATKERIGEVWDQNCAVFGGVSGHAGVFSTAFDLEKLSRELFRSHRGSESGVKREELAFLMHDVRDNSGGIRRVGFDVPSGEDSLAGRYFSGNSAGHLGFTGVSLWLDFDRYAGMVFLTNRVYYDGDMKEFNLLRRRVHDMAWEESGL